ncbi:MAG: RNA methyltransferase [Fibrobacter sp.]|nr:RNA methyltransferase [Fibrobacter sp.]
MQNEVKDQLKERREAYRVLMQWVDEGAFIKDSGLSPFAMEIALGVCRRHLYLDYFVKTLTKKKPLLELQMIIEMGLFQMFFMSVPDYAAVSTSANLAKLLGFGDGAARLVNGVLGAAKKNGLPQMPPQRVRRVSIENSVPEWIVRRWFDVYGGDTAELLAKKTLERPTEWLRVNLQKTSAPKLAQKLGFEGASILYDRYVQVPADAKLKPILESESFAKGEFSLQNPSAYEVVKLLDLKPGLKVWDACAAPGGKSALMAEMDPGLCILASDVSDFRMDKMQDLANRLGLENISTACIDVLSLTEGNGMEFIARGLNLSPGALVDRILLDVPCSNMGVIARRPEAVYRLTNQSLKELADLQYRLLESAATVLAEKGIIVYATCSPDPVETTQVISKFLKAHPNFAKAGDAVLPGNKDSRFDGFFAQALIRNA